MNVALVVLSRLVPRFPLSRPLPAFAVAILLLVAPLLAARAATLPTGFTETLVTGGIAEPTAMAFAPDGRLFVCQQGGQLRVIKNGALLATPFLTVAVHNTGERGLLGVTFDPNFSSNGFVYIYYTTAAAPIHNRVSRFVANGDVAVPGSEVVLLDLDNLSGATNHNGGAMHFGSDGKLYIAVGENANAANAQTLNNLLGKMLRINNDGSIPTNNPFYNTATGKNRAIWALGLRNPFTFDVQPGTGRIFINDVGAGTWEEINDGSAGANYGWPTCEGGCNNGAFTNPVFQYAHGSTATTGCAVTGGAFYNPPTVQFPASYTGHYFFADLCSGWIRVLNPSTGTATGFATGLATPVDLKVGPEGSLYYLVRGNGGQVWKIDYPPGQQPATITADPANRTVAVGQPATFSVSASGTPPLRYQWQRNGINISGATAASYTLGSAASGDNGARFRCVVSNDFGSDTSSEAILTVTSNGLPAGTITAPVAGTLYRAGETIQYSGTGSDPEDGTLPASAFTWKVDFHHSTHTHPFIPNTSGAKSGSFTVPDTGETATDVFYRIYLTVRDAAGQTRTSFRDIRPRTVLLSLETSPPGLQLTLDGQPRATPFTVSSVVGMKRTLGVVSPQTVGGVTYAFDSWSDRGSVTHTVATPAVNTTYSAVFRVNSGRIGSGDGLAAAYYDNRDFTGAVYNRVDFTVNFACASNSPAPGIGPNTFSVRWTGLVQPQFSQNYTFFTRSDDGVRLWVNGRLLIDNMAAHTDTENSGTIALVAGQRYAIRMDYYQDQGPVVAKLLWSSPSTPKGVIPRSQLYSRIPPPTAPRNFSLAPTSGSSGAGVARTLTSKYLDDNGVIDIAEARLLVNSVVNGANALLGMYLVGSNRLYLRDNANGGWLGGFAPGARNASGGPLIISNSQGSLNATATTVTLDANLLTINWSFIPAPSFAGTKNLYLLVRDRSNAVDNWEAFGTWTITGSTATRSVARETSDPSTVALSAATARVASDSVQLTFTGALDAAAAAEAAHYQVEVNGVAVAVTDAIYNTGTHSVTLNLPAGSLRAGDAVRVSWQDLADASGASFSGQVGPLSAS